MPGKWDEVVFFSSGDEYLNSIVESIKNSTQSVWVNCYIFTVDHFTQPLIDELIHAKKRGVDVKIIVDGIGSLNWIYRLRNLFNPHQIEFAVYRPIPTKLFDIVTQIIRYKSKLSRFLGKLNKRDHRKIILIDEKIAYLGSMNLIAVHSEKQFGKSAWRDLSLSVRGEGIRYLYESFTLTWLKIQHKKPFWLQKNKLTYSPSNGLVRINIFRSWRRKLYSDLLNRILNATQCIKVVSPYFLPKRKLVRSLIAAANRGTKVEIIIPSISDVQLVKLASIYLVHRLVRNGISVHLHQNRILHSKYLIIDDYAIVGSQNMNHRSFVHDLETDVILNSNEHITQLKSIWQEDLSHSVEFKQDSYLNLNFITKLLCYLAYKIRYWL